jgi:hypothetical protein
MIMRNVQSRRIAAPPARVGALLDRLAGADDPLWPSGPWPALRMDRGLSLGSEGGHGPIRYRITEYDPGRRIRLVFDPSVGLHGHHEFTVEPDGPQRSRLVHTLSARTSGAMRWRWPVMIRWIHEAMVQDLLDNAERAATGGLSGPPARRGRWVRVLLGLRRRPRPGRAD